MSELDFSIFNDYNENLPEYKKIRWYPTWILTPTNNVEGISVYWNEIRNELIVCANQWPHEGFWYVNQKWEKDHWPWTLPKYQYGWRFIGEL